MPSSASPLALAPLEESADAVTEKVAHTPPLAAVEEAGRAGPHLLAVVLAAGAAGLVSLQLGDSAETRAGGAADRGGVVPAVSDLVGALRGVLAAEAAVSNGAVVVEAAETVVGLGADVDVVGGGAAVVERPAAVESGELGALERGAAGVVAGNLAGRCDGDVGVGAAADGHVLVVGRAARIADAAGGADARAGGVAAGRDEGAVGGARDALAGVLATAVAAAASAAVVAAHGGPVSVRAGGADGDVGAGLASPDKLEVVLAAGPAGLLSLQLGNGALARADGGADVGSVRPAVVLLVRAAVDHGATRVSLQLTVASDLA